MEGASRPSRPSRPPRPPRPSRRRMGCLISYQINSQEV